MSKSEIIPVFYIGVQRSGTTWLGNILTDVLQIPTAKHPMHYGVKESAIYRTKKYWGELNEPDQYIQFLELFTSSDYFQLVKGDKAFFYNNHYSDFYELYMELMDQFAVRQGRNTWVTKLDPAFFSDEKALRDFEKVVRERYGEAKFIFVIREYNSYIHSYLRMGGASFAKRNSFWRKYFAILTGTAFYFYYNRKIKNFIESNNGLEISYESLRGNYDQTLEKLGNFLRTETKNKSSKTKEYPRNTSFAKRKKNSNSFLIPLSKIIFEKSNFLAACLVKLRIAMSRPRNPLTWRLLKSKYFQEDFKIELKASGQQQLVDYVDQP